MPQKCNGDVRVNLQSTVTNLTESSLEFVVFSFHLSNTPLEHSRGESAVTFVLDAFLARKGLMRTC